MQRIQELDVEVFRRLSRADLQEAGRPLAGWLERQLPRSRLQTDRRPFTEQGRIFYGFYETFYHALAWYKVEKISVFKQLGWQLDERVTAAIENKFLTLIQHALAAEGDHQFDEWLRSYNPRPIACYTAIDHQFQTLTGSAIRTVLDFGSGIGRQALAWCDDPQVSFYSVDAIESLYLLQQAIYALLFPEKLVEYFLDPQAFYRALQRPASGRLYHLPTWRMDWIPDASLDLIICVQVLQEVNEPTLQYVLGECRRLIRPGGLLYIRDKEFWTPSHRIRVGRQLLRQGWQLLFRFTGDEGTQIGGTPRLWVYTGADHSRYFRPLVRLKRALLPSHSLSYDSWKDIGLPI